MKLSIDVAIINEVYNYLAKQPYFEVATLIEKLEKAAKEQDASNKEANNKGD